MLNKSDILFPLNITYITLKDILQHRCFHYILDLILIGLEVERVNKTPGVHS